MTAKFERLGSLKSPSTDAANSQNSYRFWSANIFCKWAQFIYLFILSL
ncbi:hypothetical protein CICLE_v10033387mg [Citrus x clementina]|uniref:Uncharacterized protein n=1 Tax=Citrus clementina TaxID=85681 RepID=V4TJS4_CITCL|nr:hypothetical protein CICLE_v10033387mg [Citrus x clementina]